MGVLVAVVVRERVPGLPAGHVQDPLLFVTGGDHEPFAGAVIVKDDAYAVRTTRQGIGRHVEEAAEPGQTRRKGVCDTGAVDLAPSQVIERFIPVVAFVMNVSVFDDVK